jgi:hypothetical protein
MQNRYVNNIFEHVEHRYDDLEKAYDSTQEQIMDSSWSGLMQRLKWSTGQIPIDTYNE